MQIFVCINSGGATRRVDISYRISIASRAACARSCFASFFEGARESDILRTGGVVEVEEPHSCQRYAIRDRTCIIRTHSKVLRKSITEKAKDYCIRRTPSTEQKPQTLLVSSKEYVSRDNVVGI